MTALAQDLVALLAERQAVDLDDVVEQIGRASCRERVYVLV